MPGRISLISILLGGWPLLLGARLKSVQPEMHDCAGGDWVRGSPRMRSLDELMVSGVSLWPPRILVPRLPRASPPSWSQAKNSAFDSRSCWTICSAMRRGCRSE